MEAMYKVCSSQTAYQVVPLSRYPNENQNHCQKYHYHKVVLVARKLRFSYCRCVLWYHVICGIMSFNILTIG